MKKTIIKILIFFGAINAFSQTDTVLKWLSFEEVNNLFTIKQKPIMIFCYDPSDNLSQKMLQNTYANSEVANYLNILFYSIKFDITTKDTITFFTGQKFTKNQKYHDLAYFLIGDKIKTPLLVMFDKYSQGRIFEGYRNRDTIFPVLIYYAEEVFNSTEYEDWEKLYFKAYPPGQQTIITRVNLNWITMEELPQALEKAPKKVLIDIYNNYSVAQTVMRLQVYNDPEIANYLKQHYHTVTLNARSDEVFQFKGYTYKNTNPPNGFHQFAIDALQGNMRFPAFLILDEQLNLLDRIQVFTDKTLFRNIAEYFATNSYKTIDFKKFVEQKSQPNSKSTNN